jgi:hypothetical protein
MKGTVAQDFVYHFILCIYLQHYDKRLTNLSISIEKNDQGMLVIVHKYGILSYPLDDQIIIQNKNLRKL